MTGDSSNANPARVRVGLDPGLAPWLPEVEYTLGTLFDAAGLAREWGWADRAEGAFDLYYGREAARCAAGARLVIPWSGDGFEGLGEQEPCALAEQEGWLWPVFESERATAPVVEAGSLHFAGDLVRAAFWSLSGAREPGYPRDRVDNVTLAGSFIGDSELKGRPWLSVCAARLRACLGTAPASRPAWGDAAIAISHDVDYPEIVRLVELLRRPADARAILGESAPFWQFDAWADFSESLGTQSTFYFMARQGSLLRYLRGDPDAFYDVSTPRYRTLLAELRERGCEIGLHASFRSSEIPERYAEEKRRLEEVSGGSVAGNRQHYWRLDPERPHASLAHLAESGFAYDTSLAFERMPGFRRGLCHPFRPWHPEQRRAIDLIEVPPAWMDDHYDGRLVDSAIADPEAHARSLLADVAGSSGVAVVDYHVRGMNRVFFPRWGAWLASFLPGARPTGMVGRRVGEIAEAWRAHTERLAEASGSTLASAT